MFFRPPPTTHRLRSYFQTKTSICPVTGTEDERHLPYVITQCYLLPDAGERAAALPQPDRPVQAELTLVSAILLCGAECKRSCMLQSGDAISAHCLGVVWTPEGWTG